MKKLFRQIIDTLRGFAKDQSGIGVVEIILILVIVIGLVLIFKNEITSIINSAFDSIKSDSGAILR
jgi:Flp pilus assembly pilin Flp